VAGELAMLLRFKAAVIQTDPSATSAIGSLLRGFHRMIGNHGVMEMRRGIEDSFLLRETAVLLSLPRSLVTGESALVLVSTTTRTRIHTVTIEDDGYDNTITLHQLNVSTILPADTHFVDPLSLSFRARDLTDEAFDWYSTDAGLVVLGDFRDALELFVCGNNEPETVQSGSVLRSLLLCGTNGFGLDNDGDMALLVFSVLAQIQDLIFDLPYLHTTPIMLGNLEKQDYVENFAKVRAMLLGGGAFVSDFPAMRETKSSESVDAAFSAECEGGVSAFSAIAVHAKAAIESRMASSPSKRNMGGLESALSGWEGDVNELIEEDEVTAPGPVYIEALYPELKLGLDALGRVHLRL